MQTVDVLPTHIFEEFLSEIFGCRIGVVKTAIGSKEKGLVMYDKDVVIKRVSVDRSKHSILIEVDNPLKYEFNEVQSSIYGVLEEDQLVNGYLTTLSTALELLYMLEYTTDEITFILSELQKHVVRVDSIELTSKYRNSR